TAPRAKLAAAITTERQTSARVYVCGAHGDVDDFIATFAQNVRLDDIAAEFTDRAAVENAYFAAVIIILLQLRVDHVTRRILSVYRRDVCFLHLRDAQGRDGR